MAKEFVLITGSSKGLGRELALVFSKNNYGIILHGRDLASLKKVKEEISSQNGESVVLVGDLMDDRSIEELGIAARNYNVSVLVNNAGSALSGLKQSINLFSPAQIKEIVEVHLTSPIKLTSEIYPLLKKKGNCAIININSLSGLESQEGRSAYCSSKWGLRGFTNTLRLEAEKDNIFVMGVYASRIKTRPEFIAYGWDPKEVAEKIYIGMKNKVIDLVLDDRPEEFKKK